KVMGVILYGAFSSPYHCQRAYQECLPCPLTLIPVQALLPMLDMLPHLLCRLPHLLGIVHCLLGISGALVRYALTQFLDDEAHLVSRAAEVRFKLSHTLFKQNHALFELAEPVRSRLMLLLCRCLAHLLA